MAKLPMRERYESYSLELRQFERFQTLCHELIRDLNPSRSQADSAVLADTNIQIRDVAINILKSATIIEDDWDQYLSLAFQAGCLSLLEVALEQMPLQQPLTMSSSTISELIEIAPPEHLLLASQEGIVPLLPSRSVVRALCVHDRPTLKEELLAQITLPNNGETLDHWFISQGQGLLPPGSDFLAKLLPLAVQQLNQCASDALYTAVVKRRGIHAIALHMAGARIGPVKNPAWTTPSNHALLSVLGKNTTLAEFLRDPNAHHRALELLDA